MPVPYSIVRRNDSVVDPVAIAIRDRFARQSQMHFPLGVYTMMHRKYITPVPLERVAIAEVNTMKTIPIVISELTEKIPMGPSLSHVHRVFGPRIIIVSQSAIIQEIMRPNAQFWNHLTRAGHRRHLSRQDFAVSLSSGARGSDTLLVNAAVVYLEFMNVSEFVISLFRESRVHRGGVVDVANVPRFQPLLKWQHKLARRHWSCEFRFDYYKEKQLVNKVFSRQEEAFHIFIMRVVHYVREFSSNQEVGIAVNPNTQNVVALCFLNEDRPGHPSSHCPMMLMNTLDQELLDQRRPPAHPRDRAVPNNWLRELGEYYPRLRFSTQVDDMEAERNGPYYPTVGYDMYLSREPCIQCAMTMRSNRIMRVFYDESHFRGGLGSNEDTMLYNPFDHLPDVYRVCYTS